MSIAECGEAGTSGDGGGGTVELHAANAVAASRERNAHTHGAHSREFEAQHQGSLSVTCAEAKEFAEELAHAAAPPLLEDASSLTMPASTRASLKRRTITTCNRDEHRGDEERETDWRLLRPGGQDRTARGARLVGVVLVGRAELRVVEPFDAGTECGDPTGDLGFAPWFDA